MRKIVALLLPVAIALCSGGCLTPGGSHGTQGIAGQANVRQSEPPPPQPPQGPARTGAVASQAHTDVSAKIDLSRLNPKDLPPEQYVALAISYLRQTMSSPPPPSLSLGGGPHDAGSVQEVILEHLVQDVPQASLRAAVASQSDPAIRDRLTVALGETGDHAVAPELRRVLSHAPEGFMRAHAAIALKRVGDPGARAVLRAALKDPYTAVSTGEAQPIRPPAKVYPVRGAAAKALAALGESVPESVWRQPRDPRDSAELVSYLLEDKYPPSCLSAVQILGTFGDKGRPYLEAFAKENAASKDLADSVKAAQEILAKAPQPGK